MIQIASFRIRILGFPFPSPMKKLIAAVGPLDSICSESMISSSSTAAHGWEKTLDSFLPMFSVGFAEVAEGAI